MKKQLTSVRISGTAKELLKKLSKKLSVSQSAVLEIAIRALARREGVKEDEAGSEGQHRGD